MCKHRIVMNLSIEAAARLAELALADNCSRDAIVEHLVMGRMLVKDGRGTVPELETSEDDREVVRRTQMTKETLKEKIENVLQRMPREGMTWSRVVDMTIAIRSKDEALALALAELERISEYSGAAGNWPLQEAVTKVRAALGL